MSYKFKKGQPVIYKNSHRVELGIIKRQFFRDYNNERMNMYFINYHTGDTASATREEDIFPISNEYAFLILRRKAETFSIDETPARQLATNILTTLIEENFLNIKDEEYYKAEDLITTLINEWEGKENV